ncbi:MAG: PAS domain S-box protein [Acidobacteria bacterium]|nr:PAS domain S-box protein [Acidobacteriota bacterium]
MDSTRRDASDRYRQLIELSPDSILIGRNGLIVYANPATLRLVGATSLREVLGKSPADLLHPDSRPRVVQRIAELRTGQTLSSSEERIVRLDGTVLDVEITGSAFEDHLGRGLQVIVRDITTRKRTEAALRESEERLRLAFAGAQEGVWDWNLETGAVVYSTRWARMLGYELHEIEPHVQSWERLLHPDDAQRAADTLEAAQRGEGDYAVELRLRHKGGHYVDVLSRGFPVRRESDGRIIRIVGTHLDLTERKRAEAKLRADEHRLRAFLENSAVAGWLKDEDGRYVFLSKNFQRFGMGIDEWVGRTDFEFWPREVAETFRRNDLAVLKSGKSVEVVEEAVYPDGTRSWWLNHKFRLEGADGKQYVGGLGVDVTARTNAEELLRHAHDELEERVRERTTELASANEALQLEMVERERAEGARRELLARLVFAQEDERRRIAREMHDQLGEQLTALGLHVRGLQSAVADSPSLAARAETLERVTQELDRSVDELVWALRPTALDDLGLRAALENYLQDWSSRVGVTAELHTAGLADDRLTTEIETTLYRIAQEALNNVAKHAKASNVAVLLERRPDHISLVIEDDGVGFESSGPGRPSHGFGLLGMQERAALIGANLEIESQAGAGTSILVRIAIPHEGRLA